MKPTPPRPSPVASLLKTPGSLRQRAVPRLLKKTFEELFGDCSDLDNFENQKRKGRKKNSEKKKEEDLVPSLIQTRRYPGTI